MRLIEVWTATLGGSDTDHPSSRVGRLHIPTDKHVLTEHCLHAGIYYDHYRLLMCVFGPAPLYRTCRDYRYNDESVQGIIDDIIF